MVVIIKIGRRIPRGFFKSAAYRTAGFLTFQENMWLIISRALQMEKSDCDSRPEEQVIMTLQNKEEDDGLHYKFQWKIVTVSSIFPEKEQLTYDNFMTLYTKIKSIRNILDKKLESNPEYSKTMENSKVLSVAQFNQAKTAGYGALNNKDVASKLLEMGIITYAEIRLDKDARGVEKD